MACKLDLPKEIIVTLIEQGIGLRQRQIKAATNSVIKQALEQEIIALSKGKETLETTK